MSGQTLEDVAKRAGVSRSTVSRVLNDMPHVREEVRERVWEVIRKTGYQPNAAARTLASQRSWTLGLVIPRSVSSFFTDPFFPRLTQGIAQACNEFNYTLSFFLVGTKKDEEMIFPRVSRQGMLDGILVQAGQTGDLLIDRLVETNVPVVIIGRPHSPSEASYIDIDNISASCQAVEHLISCGRSQIGTISGPLNSTVGLDRLAGYEKALSAQGWVIDEGLIVEGDFTEVGGYTAMQQLLKRKGKLDAVFAASDLMAIGAMRAVREVGLEVPDDIAFVSFDDLPIATLLEHRLTTVRQPGAEFGYRAVETLIDLIEHGTKPARRVIMGTELIVRDTCGALQKSTAG